MTPPVNCWLTKEALILFLNFLVVDLQIKMYIISNTYHFLSLIKFYHGSDKLFNYFFNLDNYYNNIVSSFLLRPVYFIILSHLVSKVYSSCHNQSDLGKIYKAEYSALQKCILINISTLAIFIPDGTSS